MTAPFSSMNVSSAAVVAVAIILTLVEHVSCAKILVDEPLFTSVEIDEELGGLVLVQPSDYSQKGVVCTSTAERECEIFSKILCPVESVGVCPFLPSEGRTVAGEGTHSVALQNVSCLQTPHVTYLSMCSALSAIAKSTACPPQQSALRVSCRQDHRRKMLGLAAAADVVVVYPNTILNVTISSRIAATLFVSNHRVTVNDFYRYGDYVYGTVEFVDVASAAVAIDAEHEAHRAFLQLAGADGSDQGVTTTTTTTTTTTVTPMPTTPPPTTTTTTTTRAPPTTTTTTHAPATTTTTTRATTTTTSTAVPPTTAKPTTTVSSTSTKVPTTTTSTTQPSTSAQTAGPSTTVAPPPSDAPSAPPPGTNDDLPAVLLIKLLTVVPIPIVANWGVLELRSDNGVTQCQQRNGTLTTNNTVLRCLTGPNVTDVPPESWFASKLAVASGPVGNLTGESGTVLIGTVCGSGWTDANASSACAAVAPAGSYPRGFVIRGFDDTQQNQWPILASKSNARTDPVLSSCFAKRNNCTHADDAGVVCSKSIYSNHVSAFHFSVVLDVLHRHSRHPSRC